MLDLFFLTYLVKKRTKKEKKLHKYMQLCVGLLQMCPGLKVMAEKRI